MLIEAQIDRGKAIYKWKRKRNIYKLRKEGGGKGTKSRRETGPGKSKEMTAKEEFKAVRNSWARTRNIVVDSLAVGSPQSVERHRMTGLETITIVATQEPGTAGRPGKKSLL